MRRPDLPSLRAAWWTFRAARSARRQIAAGRFDAVRLPPVPVLPPEAARGVAAVLRRRDDTCLVRATVRQRWWAAQGSPRDLVIGVTPPSSGFLAHAWLEGDPPCHDATFHELRRQPAKT